MINFKPIRSYPVCLIFPSSFHTIHMLNSSLCIGKRLGVQGGDKKSRILDSSYFNNFVFLKNLFLNYTMILNFIECSLADVGSPGMEYSSDLLTGPQI